MKKLVLILASILVIYVGLYVILRGTHVFVHTIGLNQGCYQSHEIHLGSRQAPLRIKSKPVSWIVSKIFFPMCTTESAFWYNQRPIGSTVPIDAPLYRSSEEAFIERLRIMAELVGDGAFPEQIDPMGTHLKQILADLGLSSEFEKYIISHEISVEKQRRLSYYPTTFLRYSLGDTGDWHYAGKGVKLGDSKTPIVWYRRHPDHPYHVVYGDLSIHIVEDGNMPFNNSITVENEK